MAIKIDAFDYQSYNTIRAGFYEANSRVVFEDNCWQLDNVALPQTALTLNYPCYKLGTLKKDANDNVIMHEDLSDLGFYVVVLGDTEGYYASKQFRDSIKLSCGLVDVPKQALGTAIPSYYLIEIGNAFYIGVSFLGKSYIVPFAINSFDFDCNVKELHIYYNPLIASCPTTVLIKSSNLEKDCFTLHASMTEARMQSDYLFTFCTLDGSMMEVSPDILGHNLKEDFDYLKKFGASSLLQLSYEGSGSELSDEAIFSSVKDLCSLVRNGKTSDSGLNNLCQVYFKDKNFPKFDNNSTKTCPKLAPSLLEPRALQDLLDIIPSPMDYAKSFHNAMHYIDPGNYEGFSDVYSLVQHARNARLLACAVFASQCITITISDSSYRLFLDTLLPRYKDVNEDKRVAVVSLFKRIYSQNYLAPDFIPMYIDRNLILDTKDTHVVDALIKDSFLDILYAKLSKSFGNKYPQAVIRQLYNKKNVFKAGKSGRATLTGKIPYAAEVIERDAFEWIYMTNPVIGAQRMSHLNRYWGIDMLCLGSYVTIFNSAADMHGDDLCGHARNALHTAWVTEYKREHPEYFTYGNRLLDKETLRERGIKVALPRYNDPTDMTGGYSRIGPSGGLMSGVISGTDEIEQFLVTYRYVSFLASSVARPESLRRVRARSGHQMGWQFVQAGLAPLMLAIPKNLRGSTYSDSVASEQYDAVYEIRHSKDLVPLAGLTGTLYVVSLFQRLILAEMSISKDPACAYYPQMNASAGEKYIRQSIMGFDKDSFFPFYYSVGVDESKRVSNEFYVNQNITGTLDQEPLFKANMVLVDYSPSIQADYMNLLEDISIFEPELENTVDMTLAESIGAGYGESSCVVFAAPAIIDGNYFPREPVDTKLDRKTREENVTNILKWFGEGASMYSDSAEKVPRDYCIAYLRNSRMIRDIPTQVFASAPAILQRLQAVLALSDESNPSSFYNKFLTFYRMFINVFLPTVKLDTIASVYKAQIHTCNYIQSNLEEYSFDAFMKIASEMDWNAFAARFAPKHEESEVSENEGIIATDYRADLTADLDAISKFSPSVSSGLQELQPRTAMLSNLFEAVDAEIAHQNAASSQDTAVGLSDFDSIDTLQDLDSSNAPAGIDSFDTFDDAQDTSVSEFDTFDSADDLIASGLDSFDSFDSFDSSNSSEVLDEDSLSTPLESASDTTDSFDTLDSDDFDEFDSVSLTDLDSLAVQDSSDLSGLAAFDSMQGLESLASSDNSDTASEQGTNNTQSEELSKPEATIDIPSAVSSEPNVPVSATESAAPSAASTVNTTQPVKKRPSFAGKTFTISTDKQGRRTVTVTDKATGTSTVINGDSSQTSVKPAASVATEKSTNVTTDTPAATASVKEVNQSTLLDTVNDLIESTISNPDRVKLTEIVYLPSEEGNPFWSPASKDMLKSNSSTRSKGIVLAPEKQFTHKPYFIGPDFSHIVAFCDSTGAQCFYDANYDMCFVMNGILMHAYVVVGNSVVIKRVQSRVRQNGYSPSEFNFKKLALSSFI